MLAGPGSGKTAVAVGRVAHLVDEVGVAPWTILAVTFTNKAAGEMRTRLHDVLHERADQLWIGTFHSVSAKLLRRHGDAIGVSRAFQILDDGEQVRVVERILKELGRDERASARAIIARIDYAKTRGVTPDRVPVADDEDSGADQATVEEVYRHYEAALAREHALDFNDLLLKADALFAHAEVGKALREKFQHVLVDEFQDTNDVQYAFVKKLSGRTRNLTIVADEDQAIYEWRSANPRNVLDFERVHRGATVIKLERNYRSTNTILAAAVSVISRNRDRYGKRLWTEVTDGGPVVQQIFDDDYGEARYVAASIRSQFDRGGGKDGIAVLYRTNAQARTLEEAMRAYRVPARVVGATSFFDRKEVKDVLAYLRLIDAPTADSAFERAINTPARGIGEVTLRRLRVWSRAEPDPEPEVTGVADLFPSPAAPPTSAALREACMMDALRAAIAGEIPGVGAIPKRRLAQFGLLIDGLRDLANEDATVQRLVVEIVERSGMKAKLEAENSQESRARLDHLSELVTIAGDDHDLNADTGGDSVVAAPSPADVDDGYGGSREAEGDEDDGGQGGDFPSPSPTDAAPVARDPRLRISRFLERVALAQAEEAAADAAAERSALASGPVVIPPVQLMTIHMAKGLEWGTVYVTGLEEGLFPSLRVRRGQDESALLEEERRLMYVAITRARERLTLTCARTRRVWGEIRECVPSRFLAEAKEAT